MNGTKRSWDDMDDAAAAAAAAAAAVTMDSFTAAFGNHGQDHSTVTITTDGTRLDDNASAASRQKSCNACVRGKRRCDKRTPQCSRCSAKGLDCIYQKLPPGASTAETCSSAGASAANLTTESATESARPLGSVSAAATAGGTVPASCAGLHTVSSSSAASTASCVSDVPEFDMSFDMDSLGTDTSPESLQADIGVSLGNSTHGSGGLDFSIVDLMAQTAGGEHDIWNLHPFAETTTDKLQIPPVPTGHCNMTPPSMLHQNLQQLQPIRDLSLIKDADATCMEIDPLAVHDPNTRIGYIVSFLTSMHGTFTQTRALPFMHPRLWVGQLPKVILAAFSASSAYTACGPANKGWTVRLLVDAGREIHREGERAISNEDKLSRVQALLILNSMRIFDGDLGLRAAAEREVPVLISWLKELNSIRENLEMEESLGGVNAAVREKSPKSWESWVFLESCRRTLITSYAIICISCMLKSETPPLANDDMWHDDIGFTASRHLWDAPNSVEFYRAWREKPQFSIQNMVFKDFWMYARPDDCDDFTKLMLTTQVGLDAMAHFMNGDAAIPVNPGRAP
ncbi:C6 zinc finger domain protein [Metarhizium guizhouense ARSEF 977]|uniref:C6 zinc finger domain protein n=1 Tax=Metarhizium guizhouense (strain ARSEF 977) TaxID=1276136 RepID=A0A0B4GYY5_METGA|nr:C6 zinc finger domain protein [Metarhizium guizhouense ARSEF 977]